MFYMNGCKIRELFNGREVVEGSPEDVERYERTFLIRHPFGIRQYRRITTRRGVLVLKYHAYRD